MFSRSEKTEDIIDPTAEPSEPRSPLMLAAVAGLLAVAGAFLLVSYLNGGDDDVATPAMTVDEETGEVVASADETSRQVLVVVETIPRGTSVTELIEAPTVYLSARAVPEQFVAASAITSVAELSELEGFVLSSDALPGEQLLRGRFRDANDFDATNETFLEAETDIEIPDGHHAVVVSLPAENAFGGNLGRGDKVTVIASFRVSPPEAESFEISLVVLNEVVVLNKDDESEEDRGQLSSEFTGSGIAAAGDVTLTVAVTPEELTDLTYAMTYGEITLATAVEGLTNEDGPRAVTTLSQVLGDDGVWLTELEDGNLVDVIGLYPNPEDAEGQSIQLDLPESFDESNDPDPDTDADIDIDIEAGDGGAEAVIEEDPAGDS